MGVRGRGLLVSVGLLVAMSWAAVSDARWVSLSPKFKSAKKSSSSASAPWSSTHVEMRVLRSDVASTVVEFVVEGLEWNALGLPQGSYQSLVIPGTGITTTRGEPELPLVGRNIMIPAGSRPELRVISEDTVTWKIGAPVPSKGPLTRDIDPASVPYTFGKSYTGKTRFPAQTLVMGKPFQMRDVFGVNLRFFPVRYDSSEGTTIVTRRLVAEVRTSASSTRKADFSRMDRTFRSAYERAFPNFPMRPLDEVKDTAPEHMLRFTGGMLVLAPERFQETLKPLIEWKRLRGIEVWQETVESGERYQEIKEKIQSAYDKNHIAYVLLVGDSELVPFHPGKSLNAEGKEADPMYGLVAGDDEWPDIVIARFSADQESELQTMVNRTLSYERDPEIGEWMSKAVGIASEEGEPKDWERMNELRDILKGWHYTDVDQFYEPDAVTEDVINAVNEGRGFINYIGHGSTDRWVTSSFTSRDALALKNSRKWPFIVSVACVNGHFHGQESFAEAWLRSGTPEDPRGAIAMFASSTNQAWVEPLFGQREVIRELVNQETSTLGGLFLNGAIAVLESGMEEAAQTFETWHVFGDPTVMPRTQAPREIVGVTPKFVAGQTKFELKVDGKDITGALSQADQLVAVGTSDAKGRLVMKPIRPLRAGEATFVLTGVDRVARVETVNPRLSETAFLTSEDLRFNGRVETLVYPGERVEISGALRNIAEVPADLARVSLEVLSGPAIAVRASSETPRLASLGVVAWTPAEISFEVDPAARANEEIVLRLAWDVPGGQSGFEMLTLVVARAALKPSQAGLGEYVHGYYEGIRPGAEGNVSFSLINNGSEVIRHAVLRVVDGYSCVERSQGEVLVETLAPGARVDVSGLRIKIDELCVEGSEGVLRLEGTYMNGAQAPTALSVDIPFAVGADRIFSRVYEALALPIADGAAEPTNIALPIQGNGDVKEIQITLKIKHPCAADLDLTLVHPDGTEVSLKRPPGSPASDVNITWGKGGVPVEEFKKFLGKTVDGTWTLQVRDATKADLGILDSVRMLVWAD